MGTRMCASHAYDISCASSADKDNLYCAQTLKKPNETTVSHECVSWRASRHWPARGLPHCEGSVQVLAPPIGQTVQHIHCKGKTHIVPNNELYRWSKGRKCCKMCTFRAGVKKKGHSGGKGSSTRKSYFTQSPRNSCSHSVNPILIAWWLRRHDIQKWRATLNYTVLTSYLHVLV